MVMKPLGLELSTQQVAELRRRLKCRDLVPNERMRLDCVRLAAQGRTAPQIALILDKHVVTVRKALHRFLDGGFGALADAARPGRPPRWGREDLDALEAMLDEAAVRGEIWDAAGTGRVAAPRTRCRPRLLVAVSAAAPGRFPLEMHSGQHPAPGRPGPPGCRMGTTGGSAAVRLRSEVGIEDLYYLDECGFSPTLPTGYTWARTGTRVVVNREDTKNRRVNVLGALNDTGPEPELLWTTVEHRIDAATVLDFVCNHIARLPGGADRLSTSPVGFKRSRPCTIVLDNASINHADAFKGRREELAAIGVHLFYLPPRSPELNRIERIWRSVKYQDMPVRAYTTAKELHTAVDRALNRRAAALTPATAQILKIA
ncbi:transposase [Streptomyces luteireticuli]|uniref:Tc1-like transposase DDE domain-containing protein n=1 Tax=Streptomyces luteireticuli TaxID=173858 RepID=A0ABN0YXI5_9ACTN